MKKRHYTQRHRNHLAIARRMSSARRRSGIVLPPEAVNANSMWFARWLAYHITDLISEWYIANNPEKDLTFSYMNEYFHAFGSDTPLKSDLAKLIEDEIDHIDEWFDEADEQV